MATVTTPQGVVNNGFPTSDGRILPETDWHRNLMFVLIETLAAFYAANARVYVSGDLLVFYEPGNKRRHISPDVFVVRGVPKCNRPNYLIWEEARGPEFVIEVTSSSTRHVDWDRKFKLYRDTLKVTEYFLFDPRADYLEPRLQGYRLRAGKYHPIRPVAGHLPSRVTGLHLETHGDELRLYDPTNGEWLLTPRERAERAEAEADQLRRELEELRRRLPGQSS